MKVEVPMSLTFNTTEKHILRALGGYSKQLINYWENAGRVPSQHLLNVAKLTGRKIEELVGGEDDSKAISNG
jgi:hypothetical protein